MQSQPLPDLPLEACIRSLRLVVFDFDGVFTDNRVYVFEDGREAVCCSRADGLGLQQLTGVGLGACILSTETNPVVGARAKKLGIPCVQGCRDKRQAMEALIREAGVSLNEVAFIGNDINDLTCLQAVGLPIVVNDAHPAVTAVARYRTQLPGGQGAVREICDFLVSVRKQTPAIA